MEEKSKLEILRDKINYLRGKNKENNTPWEIETKSSFSIPQKIVTGALVASLAVGTALSVSDAMIDHASEVCLVTKAISIFDREEGIKHQIAGIKADYQDEEDLSVEYQVGHYIAPEGGILEGDKVISQCVPQETTVYFVPAGYVLSGTVGIKTNEDGSQNIISAQKQTTYSVPEGYVLTTDKEGRLIGQKTYSATYIPESIITTTSSDQKILKLK